MSELQTTNKLSPDIIEQLIIRGDISGLNKEQKLQYYKYTCERVGLDPEAQPFQYIKLQGKEVLYLVRAGAQQLNQLHKVSHQITSRELIPDAGIYQVTARASQPDNRYTESIGAVNIQGLKGDAYANAIMKAETKAKRRSTLDLLGLGMLDETEVETIPNAKTVEVERLPEKRPEVRNLNGDFESCEKIADVKRLWETLSDDERKAYSELKRLTESKIAGENIEVYIKKLKKENYEKNLYFIEDAIEKSEPDRKKEIIDLLTVKLATFGVQYEYQGLPF